MAIPGADQNTFDPSSIGAVDWMNGDSVARFISALKALASGTPANVSPGDSRPFGFHPNTSIGYAPPQFGPPPKDNTPSLSAMAALMPNLAKMAGNLRDVQATKAAYDRADQQVQSRWNDYDKNAPPSYHPPTYGTKDLVWAIPALLAAFSGRSGQQLAKGLLGGAFQGKQQSNQQYNEDQAANWRWTQEKRLRDAQMAEQTLQQTSQDYGNALDDYRLSQAPVSGPDQAPISKPFNPNVGNILANLSSRRAMRPAIGPAEQYYAQRNFKVDNAAAELYAKLSTAIGGTSVQSDPEKEKTMLGIQRAFRAIGGLQGEASLAKVAMNQRLRYSDDLGAGISNLDQIASWKLVSRAALAEEYRKTRAPELLSALAELDSEIQTLYGGKEWLGNVAKSVRRIFGLGDDGTVRAPGKMAFVGATAAGSRTPLPVAANNPIVGPGPRPRGSAGAPVGYRPPPANGLP